jgi:hypothetical protein
MTTHRTTRRVRRLYPGLTLIMLLLSASPVRGEGPTPQSTASRRFELLRALYTELGVSASDDEIASSMASDPCDATCLQNSEKVYRMLVASRGRPVELILRHAILQNAYFVQQTNPRALMAALLRTDPPSVIDVANKTIVTRGDVIGVINLVRFGRGSGAPEHYQPTEREVREVAGVIEAERAKRGRFALFGVFAAEMWLGVRQAWPSLTAKERRVVRDHAAKGVKQPLPGAMYARLLGIDREVGDLLRKQEVSYLSPATGSADQVDAFLAAYVKLGMEPVIWSHVRP